MAQHDFDVANGSGAGVRADLNSALEALVTANSGAAAPSVTFANMFWYDSANALLKLRNPANSGWITIASVSGSTFALDISAFADDAITNAKLANMADGTIKGRALGAGAGDPTDLTPAQVRTLINLSNVTPTRVAFTASGTWTKPAGLKFVRVTVVGGGGGGGGSAASNSGGGGGGGGASYKLVLAASLGSTETVTIGAGGAAAVGDNTGTTGGTSSFGSHALGLGGVGGTRGTFGGAGGAGGLGASGNLNVYGHVGQSGTESAVNIRPAGGASVLSGGVNYSVGSPANTGAGGSGSLGNVGQQAGGSGYILVEEYY